MSEQQNPNINIIEILMKIKEDVSSIKTDMANFKESQRTEKEVLVKEIADVRSDYKRDLASFENKVTSRMNNLQTVQDSLVGDVDTLKHAEEKKDAQKYRMTVAFILTAIGGMLLAKLLDFVLFCLKTIGK